MKTFHASGSTSLLSFNFSQESLQQIKLPNFPLSVVFSMSPSATSSSALSKCLSIVGTTFFFRHLRIVRFVHHDNYFTKFWKRNNGLITLFLTHKIWILVNILNHRLFYKCVKGKMYSGTAFTTSPVFLLLFEASQLVSVNAVQPEKLTTKFTNFQGFSFFRFIKFT